MDGRFLRVAAFTGSVEMSASRFRVRQYIPKLRELGVDVTEFVAKLESYPPESRLLRPLWGPATLAQRLPGVCRSYGYDVTLLQRDMLSTFLTLEPLTKRPRVLDVDDALWLHPRGRFFEKLVRLCDGVLCGNTYIAETVRRWSPQVRLLPTAVDTARFRPIGGAADPDCPVIGWSGLPSGFPFLRSIEKSLATILERHPAARLRVVSRTAPPLRYVPKDRVEFVQWSERVEVESIQTMSIGLMPLDDTAWCLGKCSYKMLLYMACGVPAVVSPVGMNAELLAAGRIGFGPRTPDEWVDAIEALLRDPGAASEMGRAGRELVVARYGLDVLAPVLARHLREFS